VRYSAFRKNENRLNENQSFNESQTPSRRQAKKRGASRAILHPTESGMQYKVVEKNIERFARLHFYVFLHLTFYSSMFSGDTGAFWRYWCFLALEQWWKQQSGWLPMMHRKVSEQKEICLILEAGRDS